MMIIPIKPSEIHKPYYFTIYFINDTSRTIDKSALTSTLLNKPQGKPFLEPFRYFGYCQVVILDFPCFSEYRLVPYIIRSLYLKGSWGDLSCNSR